MSDATSSENHTCDVVMADFIYGVVFCGQPATKQVDCGSGCMHYTCDEHAQSNSDAG